MPSQLQIIQLHRRRPGLTRRHEAVGALKDATGSYSAGVWAMCGMLLLSTVLVGVLARLVPKE